MRDELLVKDLMTRDVVTLYENEDLLLAEHVMRLARIRHLPVVRGHALVGLVTHRDLLRASVSSLAGMSPLQDASVKRAIEIPEVMQKDVTTIGPREPARRAARLMLERQTPE
jgi:CBS domain-containing membrane protein